MNNINHIKLDYPKIEQINSDSGRLYETSSGNKYPSITTVLSKTSDNTWLEKWKSRIGEKEAEKISKYAAIRGTALHSYCEDYLKNIEPKVDILDTEAFNSFKKVLPNINNIYAMENRLFSDKFETAGTTDLIAEYEGSISVIDWKTSRRVKNKSQISNYFIQCAFYALAFYEMFKIPVSQIVIVMYVDDCREPIVFKENVKDWVKEFIEVRKQFKKQEGY